MTATRADQSRAPEISVKMKGLHLNAAAWDVDFRDQTGRNVNVAVNGIAKLLGILSGN